MKALVIPLSAGALLIAWKLARRRRKGGAGRQDAGNEMKIERISDERAFRELRGEWNALLERSGARSVFLTWEWLYHWWRHFKADKELYVLTARLPTGELAGIAPLCRESVRLFNVLNAFKLKFLGSEKVGSDFLDFILQPGREEAVLGRFLEYIAARQQEWDIFEMRDVDESSPSLSCLRRRFGGTFPVIESRSSVCPYIKLPENYDLFVASLSANLRADLKKKTRSLMERRRLVFTMKDDPSAAQAIDQLFRLHADGFRVKQYQRQGESSFSGEDIRRFQNDVIPALIANRWARIYSLEHKGDMIACLYAFAYKNNLFCYQSGFDSAWYKLSPGTVLAGCCIRNSIEEGLNEFHYLRGTETYKARWTQKAIHITNMTVANNNVRGLAFAVYLGGKKGMKRFLGKSAVKKPPPVPRPPARSARP